MEKKFLWLLILLLSACSAVSPVEETRPGILFREAPAVQYGLDILGLAGQDIKVVKATLKPQVGLGALVGTFGDIFSPLRQCLDTGKVAFLRIHLGDGTCIRNHSCASGSVQYSNYPELIQRAKAVERICHAYPTVPCYTSPFLEHDSKDKSQVNKWYDIIREYNPSSTPVVSAFTGYRPPGILQEYHGNSAKGDIVSNDGESYFDSNIDAYKAGGHVISFAWWHRLNKRVSGEKGTPPPPKQRKPKATKDELQAAVYTLLNFEPPAPKVKGCPTIRRPQLLKTNAEDYNSNDPRENKPLFITQENFSKGWGIWTVQGRKIGCANNYGPYSGGGYRYYVGSCSGETSWGLFKELGSEWALFKNGKTCYTINILRRQPYYK